jgi:hypothetical protein
MHILLPAFAVLLSSTSPVLARNLFKPNPKTATTADNVVLPRTETALHNPVLVKLPEAHDEYVAPSTFVTVTVRQTVEEVKDASGTNLPRDEVKGFFTTNIANTVPVPTGFFSTTVSQEFETQPVSVVTVDRISTNTNVVTVFSQTTITGILTPTPPPATT